MHNSNKDFYITEFQTIGEQRVQTKPRSEI